VDTDPILNYVDVGVLEADGVYWSTRIGLYSLIALELKIWNKFRLAHSKPSVHMFTDHICS
jgi:hypothetical protein